MQEHINWIMKTLVDSDEFIETVFFEKGINLYSTPLGNSFISTIINGIGNPARFKVNPGEFQYSHIVRNIRTVSDSEPAIWFYYTVADNAVGEMNDIWECNYEYCLEYPLEKFEREPAKEGGVSYLGLLSKNKSWLLLHHYEPAESFGISFHGNHSIVEKLQDMLE